MSQPGCLVIRTIGVVDLAEQGLQRTPPYPAKLPLAYVIDLDARFQFLFGIQVSQSFAKDTKTRKLFLKRSTLSKPILS
jgi:hypothetical protein